ncbi:MAG: MFS transporter [Oscillospiraceae bacterium]|nr:MFS transporter [Oscillospiraceae bacterium]
MSSNKRNGLITAIICFAVFFAGTYAQYQISPLSLSIMEQLGINEVQYSQLFTVCMFPALLLSIVSGLLCDKYGVKATVGIALILSTAGIVLRVFTNSYAATLGCMLVLGLGCVFMTASSAKVLSPHFSPKELSSIMGPVSAGTSVAMFVAMATTAWLPGVKAAYTVAAVLAVLVLAAWYICIKNPEKAPSEPTEGVSMKESLLACLKSRNVWLGGLTLMFVLVPQVIISSFLPQALQTEKGMSGTLAGYITSAYMLGSIAGSMAGPKIFATFKPKRAFLTALSVLTAIIAAFGWHIANPVILIIVMVICGFSINTFMPIVYALPISLPEIGPVYAGTAGGLSATIQMIGATIIPSYILAPIFKNNFKGLFIAAGCFALCSVISANLLPLFGKKK